MDYPRLSHLGTGAGNPLLTLAIALRQFLEGGIRRALPDPQAALLFGILLGTRTRALGALTNPFIVTGMIHVIAISGLKVSIVAGSVAAVARRFLSARIAWLPPAAALLLYVLMTDATPAGLRSALMWGLALAALRLGRRSDAATSLALAAALLALLNPRIPWDLGFQLSLAGTAAIVLLEPGIEHRLRRLPAVMRETAAVTLAAQIGTLPLLISGFGQISLSAPLANTLLLPLLGPIMALGFVVALAGAVLPPLGILLGWLLYPFLTLMIAGVQLLARLPLAALPAATWPLLPVAGYYALVGLTAWRPLRAAPALHIPTGMLFGKARPLWVLGTSGALLLATLAWQAPRSVYTLSILYLRGGQAIMLTTPHGHTVLIDGGDAPSLLDAALGGRLPFWRSRLDLVALSDTDAAHVGGLRDLTARYSIGRALDPGAVYPSATYALWRAALRDAGVPEAKLRLGARYQLDRDAYLDVLLPSALNPYDAGARTALRLVLGRFSLLLLNRYALVADPSEIGADGWRRDTMLVLPSGASDPGLAAAWIRSQRPRLVALPSPDDARDDPTADAVARRVARGMGAQVWQSSNGRSLEITTDGLRYTMRVTS
jgi:competence protein ComEC